jgi:hypothetical protein
LDEWRICREVDATAYYDENYTGFSSKFDAESRVPIAISGDEVSFKGKGERRWMEGY